MSATSQRNVLKAIRRRLRLRVKLRSVKRLAMGLARRGWHWFWLLRNAFVLIFRHGFDTAWYAEMSGRPEARMRAVFHYLRRGRKLGHTPHPLFDPVTFTGSLGSPGIGRHDALAFYISHRGRYGQLATHPLFDTVEYLKANPEAAQHRFGAIGHYRQIGAAVGALPNSWYQPDPDREPDGLIGWLRPRVDAWRDRRASTANRWSASYDQERATKFARRYADYSPIRSEPEQVLVSVVLPVWNRAQQVAGAIASVQAQTLSDWELLIVDDGSTDSLDAVIAPFLSDPRIRLILQDHRGVARSRNTGLVAGTGRYVAWIDSDILWRPEHLAQCVSVLQMDGRRAVYDILEANTGTGGNHYASTIVNLSRLLVRNFVDQNVMVLERNLALAIGGCDESLQRAVDHDFALKVIARTELSCVPIIGASEMPEREGAPRLSSDLPSTWTNVVLNHHLVDWASLSKAQLRPLEHVTVIIPTPNDWEMTTTATEAVIRTTSEGDLIVDVIIVDNGSSATVAAALDALPMRFANVRVVHSPVNRGFALGNNLAAPEVTGGTVVFLNNDTEVQAGWLEPLVESLHDPEVHGVQSLLLYPTGSIQSAGVVFPSCGGVPHVLLQGFPREDAEGLEKQPFSALTGAALAMRFQDVVALQGFDPIFLNGMEDVDLGLRSCARKPGHFVVRPDSLVTHFESRSPGRYDRHLMNRAILLERWGNDMPGDDLQQWRGRGFDVVGYSVRNRKSNADRLSVPEPSLTRRPTVSVTEGTPQLRWALKNPAPAGPEAELWGDTHFARDVAAALRRRGQQVVIDARPEFDRATGNHDDVVLVLRGLAPYQPVYGQISMIWFISHPQMMRRRDAVDFDCVFAASKTWASRMSREWGLQIDPLLQATDPQRFNPDSAIPDSGYQVLFVGGSRKKYRPVVKQAVQANLPLTIFGPDWELIVPAGLIAGRYLDNSKLSAAYRAAGVVLNDHHEDMRVDGFLSNRLFDAVASGARVISDDVAGLGSMFGRSVQVSRHSAMFAKIAGSADLDAIFGSDTERRAVAARVHAEHSFDRRAEQLIEAALLARARIGFRWTGSS
jgi:GT2 family glycosyltransferase